MLLVRGCTAPGNSLPAGPLPQDIAEELRDLMADTQCGACDADTIEDCFPRQVLAEGLRHVGGPCENEDREILRMAFAHA